MLIHTSNTRSKGILKALLQSSLKAANPNQIMEQLIIRKGHHLSVKGLRYDLSRYQRVICVGAGKASAHMAQTLEQILGKYLEGGMVIVKDGYQAHTQHVQIVQASHPLPDARGVRATKQILNIVRSLTKHDLLIVLLSGGASSLFCAPAFGLTLSDKQRTTHLLLRAGATIHDLNTVRKHLSAVKGGQLAQATSAKILTIVLSDVLGDDVATIASGPTVPDPTTFEEAKTILEYYQILNVEFRKAFEIILSKASMGISRKHGNIKGNIFHIISRSSSPIIKRLLTVWSRKPNDWAFAHTFSILPYRVKLKAWERSLVRWLKISVISKIRSAHQLV